MSSQTFGVRAFTQGFAPGTLTIPVGATVVWSRADAALHDITAKDGAFVSGPAKGGTYSFTFTKPGTYAYTCELHAQTMKGTITVK